MSFFRRRRRDGPRPPVPQSKELAKEQYRDLLRAHIDTYEHKLDRIDTAIENKPEAAPADRAPPRNPALGYWRWTQQPNAHEVGIEGSDFWVQKGKALGLVNPSYGPNTVYVSGSKDGARGFFESEKKREYLASPTRPTETQRWYLYKIYPDEALEETLIDLAVFRPPGNRTPYATDVEAVHNHNTLGSTDSVLKKINMVPGLSREQKDKFKKYMFSEKTGSLRPRSVRLGIHYPSADWTEPPSRADIRRVDRNPQRVNIKRLAKVGAHAGQESDSMEKRFKIMQGIGRVTDEMQVQGPIRPDLVDLVGHYDLTPEMWDDYRARGIDVAHSLPSGGRNPQLREAVSPPLDADPQLVALLNEGDAAYVV
jgi:hypothetical protein